MEGKDNEMSSYIVRRGQIKAQLTKFQLFLNDSDKSSNVTQLRLRMEKIQGTWEEFNNIQNEIEIIDNSVEQLRQRDAFVDMYFEIMAKAEDKCTLAQSVKAEQNSQNIQPIGSEKIPFIKLKPLEVPVFNGSYENWAAFQDMYNAMIHLNNSITNIQKFYYLRNAVSGEASTLIQNLETSDVNYNIAWSIICKRYNNSRMVIQAHTKHIYNLEPIQKESGVKLRHFTNTLNAHIQALQALGHDPHQWGALLLHIICTKIDFETLRQWEAEISKDELPTIKQMLDFLDKRCQILESIDNAKKLTGRISEAVSASTNKFTKGNGYKKIGAFVSTVRMKCYMCSQPHPIYRCTAFLALNVKERTSKVSELKLCRNCLKNDHFAKQCSARKCSTCQKLHNSLLHEDQETNLEVVNSKESSSNMPLLSAHATKSITCSQVLLATAIIKVSNIGDSHSHMHARALLDSGSESNFITTNLVNQLGLHRVKINVPVCGIGNSKNIIQYKVTASIQSLTNSYKTTIDLLVLPKITGSLPHTPIHNVSIPNGIQIADPSFKNPGTIDILIGADTYWDAIGKGKFKTQSEGPYCQQTLFGWVVVGRAPNIRVSNMSTCMLAKINSLDFSLEERLETFWKLEEFSSKQVFTEEEERCRDHFKKYVSRDITGRFIVKLPFKENYCQLGNSFQSALRRFLSMEKRLVRNNTIYEKYKQFMSEYENLRHMVCVGDINMDSDLIDRCDYFYLPHTYVLNESSKTTKLRVVFDGSARTNSNLSLNDVLMKGPKVQPDLLYITVRFRTHKYAFSADITKMYRQVLINDSDRNYQRVLWRSNPSEKIKIYQLCTVTYGTVPASFLAIGCLDAIAQETKNVKVREIIQNDFCVDDCLTGADTLLEAIELRNEIIRTLKLGGFELSKWAANHIDLLPNTSENDIASLSIDKQNIKTLGLYWDPKADYYTYTVQLPEIGGSVTKRGMLAGIASLFDPLGLVGPIVIVAKLLMQNLWREQIGWDEPLPAHVQLEWKTYTQNLKEMNTIFIPRWLGCNIDKRVEIHGFADASMKAYGACLYIRTIDNNGKIESQLICAKSRIAPVKVISIPRLELCAAVLLSHLANAIIPALRINISRRYLWTDSTVTLAWISAESNRWKTFVSNRVGEIHRGTQRSEWGHVKSGDNPADVLSRGCTPKELKDNSQWWHGPLWLRDNAHKITPYSGNTENNIDVEIEGKTVPIAVLVSHTEVPFNIDKYSSLSKLLHVVAYLLRFKHNSLSKLRNNIKLTGLLTVEEILSATKTIIKLIQSVYISSEIKELTKGREVSMKSKLCKLKPFIDDAGIVRVGGRLSNATIIDTDQRFPIILPCETNLSKLIILHEHKRLMHAGPHATLANVRLKYWPINGRRVARKLIHQCMQCFKAKPKIVSPVMGNLPKFRVDQPTKCFENCGVDYAGPFLLKCSNRRNAAAQKSYICVFVCFATKAMHLELVCDLSTNAFLAALIRFISRRGKCRNIYSDNATCFVGANNKLGELKELLSSDDHKNRIHQFMTNHEMIWHFIPPRSPHFGGLWEAAVRSIKNHLNRNLSTTKLNYDEFYTLLVQIEACLNSRPLTPLSNDPLDLSVLTPGHFLVGESLSTLFEPDMTNLSQHLLSRWQKVQRMAQHIWRRWSTEYLSQLQGCTKWVKSEGPSIKVGSMVLIKDTNLPPLQWSLGRVSEVFHGKDGVVRVAVVHTTSGPRKRAVRLLCPLPIQDNGDVETN